MAYVKIYVVVGLHADILCKFWEPPRAGEVLPKFLVETNQLHFLAGGGPVGGTRRSTLIVFVSVAGLSAPRRLATAPTHHRPATLTLTGTLGITTLSVFLGICSVVA